MGIEARAATTVNHENRAKVSKSLSQDLIVKNLSRLPIDLVKQILSRVPVQSLLVLKRIRDGDHYEFVISLLCDEVYLSWDLSFL